jgi:tetratricopeptide (TPR) repeat protein
MTMNYRLLVMIAATAGLVGCSDNAVKGLSQDDADKLNAQHSHFDQEKDPQFNANTHFAAGQLAESQDDFPRAIAQYNEALKLDSKHIPSLYRLALVYTRLKEYPKAVDAWERYVKATDGSAEGYNNLAFCHELAGEPDKAESAYKKGIAKDPNHQACRINYGLMLARHGRTSEAIIQLQAVLTPAQVHYNLASVYEQQGRKEQAKIEYRKAIELDPNLIDAKTRLSAIE